MADKVILTDIGTHIQEWAHMGKACHKVIAEFESHINGEHAVIRIDNPQFKVYEEGDDTIVLNFSSMPLNLLKELGGEFIPIECKNCGKPIEGGEKFVKENCLYQEKDWTNCLCPECTRKWYIQNR